MVFRVEDIPEESRDDPQLASHRWNTEVRWKQAFDKASEEVYQRSLGEVPRSNGPIDPSRRHPLHQHWHHDHRWYPGRDHYSAAPYSSHESRSLTTGGMVPITASRHEARRRHHRAVAQEFVSSEFTDTAVIASSQPHDHPDNGKPATIIRNIRRTHVTSRHHPGTRNTSIVVIPDSIVIPNEMAPPPESSSIGADTTSPAEQSLAEQQHSNDWSDDAASPRQAKRTKIWENDRLEGKFDKLDLLCSATLELGPLQDNPTGCSCPKSKCIALYCDCFKAGRRCNPNTCTCLNCKNTIAESGPNGARSKVRGGVGPTSSLIFM